MVSTQYETANLGGWGQNTDIQQCGTALLRPVVDRFRRLNDLAYCFVQSTLAEWEVSKGWQVKTLAKTDLNARHVFASYNLIYEKFVKEERIGIGFAW